MKDIDNKGGASDIGIRKGLHNFPNSSSAL